MPYCWMAPVVLSVRRMKNDCTKICQNGKSSWRPSYLTTRLPQNIFKLTQSVLMYHATMQAALNTTVALNRAHGVALIKWHVGAHGAVIVSPSRGNSTASLRNEWLMGLLMQQGLVWITLHEHNGRHSVGLGWRELLYTFCNHLGCILEQLHARLLTVRYNKISARRTRNNRRFLSFVISDSIESTKFE